MLLPKAQAEVNNICYGQSSTDKQYRAHPVRQLRGRSLTMALPWPHVGTLSRCDYGGGTRRARVVSTMEGRWFESEVEGGRVSLSVLGAGRAIEMMDGGTITSW